MNYADELRELLRPLGVYEVDGGASGAELDSVGAALDEVYAALCAAEDNANPLSARAEGLTRWETLLPFAPESPNTEERRRAVAALLRIDGGSFTTEGINGTITGCGIRAVVAEAETAMTVVVSFPWNRGIPDGIDAIRGRIEEILPCHLAVEYRYLFPAWQVIEAMFSVWNDVSGHYLWQELERCGGEET